MKIKSINKIGKKLFVPLAVMLGLASCYDDGYEEFVAPTGNVNNIQPNTLFTTSPDADDNLAVVFRSYSTDAKTYAWDFGDGGTSTEENPTYTYVEGGLYQVKLTTISSDNLTAIDSAYVAPIFADFEITEQEDSQIVISNLSSGFKSVSWDFGDDSDFLEWSSIEDDNDSNDDEANVSPVYTYLSGGNFDITLTATSFLGRQVSVTKTVEGLVLSTIPNFTFSTSSLTATFTDTSEYAVSYSWDFGDGNSSTEQNPTHTYMTNGAYDVVLTTTNSAGVSKSITITVPVGGVQANFAAVIQNADFESYPTSENNNNDLVDAWTIDPDNNFNDQTATPYNFWRNDDLEAYVSTPANNGGSGTTDKASSSGTDAQSAGGSSSRSLKFDSSGERAYQPFEVETGVEYTISAFVKNSTIDQGGLVGTFYILSDQPSQDDAATLEPLTLASFEVVSSGAGNWDQASFGFSADATFNFTQSRVDENENDILISTDQKFVIFYFVPNHTSTSGDINLTDVVINTPSL